MISYVILHFNRLFLLEANVLLIRKYSPSDTQIVVADDGSDASVVDYIKNKLPIDDIYINKKNKFGQSKGSCSDTIRNAFALCKGEYIIFSEDDFFPSPNPVSINAKGTPVDGGLMPEIYFPKELEYDFFAASKKILSDRNDVHVIQMARDIDFNPRLVFGESIKGYGDKWKYLSHKKTTKYYHCNWPFMIRSSEMKQIRLPKKLPVPGVEGVLLQLMNKAWGKKRDWAVCPVRPYYIHVARGFSSQRKITGTRLTRCRNMQNILFDSVSTNDSKKLNVSLSKLYVEGKFKVDFDELINDGLNEAFMSASRNIRS